MLNAEIKFWSPKKFPVLLKIMLMIQTNLWSYHPTIHSVENYVTNSVLRNLTVRLQGEWTMFHTDKQPRYFLFFC